MLSKSKDKATHTLMFEPTQSRTPAARPPDVNGFASKRVTPSQKLHRLRPLKTRKQHVAACVVFELDVKLLQLEEEV